MPNKHSAIKDLRKSEKRAASNSRLKTHIKALTHLLKAAVNSGRKDEAKDFLKKLQQAVDKAENGNVIHANRAARIKSRMSKVAK